jgi:SAM-dependent methyltransferase
MSGQTEPIDYFGGRGTPLVRAKAQISLRARRRMYRFFEDHFRPGPADTVLDVGVTPDDTMVDSNAFEQFYPFTSQLTATSVEDASALEKRFRGLRFVQTSGSTLPFDDRAFTLAYSSAVLEHVGDRAAQESFVREVTRVADAFFIVVPNRWFPLELHTMLPVLHWLPRAWHRWLLSRLGLSFWAQEKNLNLVGARELRSLFPAGVEVRIHRHRLLGMTSNIAAYGRWPRAVSGAGPG